MFAYFCIAGKQYMAEPGDVLLDCPYVKGTVGDIVITDQVLGVNDVIGYPHGQFLKNAKVELRIIKQGLSKKGHVVKFMPQKRHERWRGYRRKYTNFQVVKVHWSE